TACPTSGEPYRDKPRIYLDRADFESQEANAFMLFEDGSIEARWDGETHRLTVDGPLEYTSPALRARLDVETFDLLDAARGDAAVEGQTLSLDRAADMFVLLRGLQASAPHLPRVAVDGAIGTWVRHPGYEG
ncbi:MAG TPA: hypothetical protein VJZ50_10485, partial [Candidatus Limnocylindrales bacterium]|nr:hypothetical protein [Candidatus Limnocylindrales bacterium]